MSLRERAVDHDFNPMRDRTMSLVIAVKVMVGRV
jgi:hypothetical protein